MKRRKQRREKKKKMMMMMKMMISTRPFALLVGVLSSITSLNRVQTIFFQETNTFLLLLFCLFFLRQARSNEMFVYQTFYCERICRRSELLDFNTLVNRGTVSPGRECGYYVGKRV